MQSPFFFYFSLQDLFFFRSPTDGGRMVLHSHVFLLQIRCLKFPLASPQTPVTDEYLFKYILCLNTGYMLYVCLCLCFSVWKLMWVIRYAMLHSHSIISQSVALRVFAFCRRATNLCVACLDLYAKRVHVSVSARVGKSIDDTLTLLVYWRVWVNPAPQSTLKRRISAGKKKTLRCIVWYTHIIHSIHTGWLGKKEIPPGNTLAESCVVDADVGVPSPGCCVCSNFTAVLWLIDMSAIFWTSLRLYSNHTHTHSASNSLKFQ